MNKAKLEKEHSTLNSGSRLIKEKSEPLNPLEVEPPEAEEQLEQFRRRPTIVDVDEAPEWQKEIANKYLVRGFRKDHDTFSDLFKSLFTAHHETLNIWTHMLAGISFIFLLLYLVCYFDEARKLFDSLFGDFEGSDIGGVINNCVENELRPLMHNLGYGMCFMTDECAWNLVFYCEFLI